MLKTPYAYFLLGCAAWLFINGIAHTVAILLQKREYDRELIRLLQDGHFLIFSGILFAVGWYWLKTNPVGTYMLIFVLALAVLSYCLIILKLIPSVGTMLISGVALIWTLVNWFGNR